MNQSRNYIKLIINCFFYLAPESIFHERIEQQIEMEMKGIIECEI